MADGFWQSLTAQSSALATWVAAIATAVAAVASVLLLRGLWLTKRSIEESKRTTLFQLMFQRFNAPNMRYSRATFAKTYLGRYDSGGFDRIVRNNVPPRHGFQILEFLNQVGYLVQTGQLNPQDAALAYSTHIQIIGRKWNSQLNEYFREDRYKPFFELRRRVNAMAQLKTLKTELEEDWVPAQRAFLESEAALDPTAKNEDELSLPPDA